MKTKIFTIVALFCAVIFSSCSKENNETEPDNPQIEMLPDIKDVSLDYHYSAQTVVLPKNVEQEGATVELKDDSYWINRLELNGKAITFEVIENTENDRGCRFDTLEIKVNEQRIGSICISQARNPISLKKLSWALPNAKYSNESLVGYQSTLSGLEMTKMIYNLSKTTNGKDNYKNYPAFAFCIDMNHNPEKNMEWHLPVSAEMSAYRENQSYKGTPLGKHPIEKYSIHWWAASEGNSPDIADWINSSSGASAGGLDKTTEMWVMAFRNGKIVE